MENTQNILVFATNIRTNNDKQLISQTLSEIPEIHQWNIDQEDVDCVLRVVSNTFSEEQIINIVSKLNFNCKPLD
nr:hypothetical protein [uncultured Flavobacterium sp.]